MKKERKEKKSRPIIPKKEGTETEVINDASRHFLNIIMPFSDLVTAVLLAIWYLHILSDLIYTFLAICCTQYTLFVMSLMYTFSDLVYTLYITSY